MTARREKVEVSVAGRLPASKFRTLQVWCDKSLRKRSEVIGIVLERVLQIYEEEADDQPLELFVRRLHLDPPKS
jgi:hypothetical protein